MKIATDPKRAICFLTFITLVIWGCNHIRGKEDLSTDEKITFRIDPEKAVEYDLSTIFSVEKYTRLETCEKCLFSNVKSVGFIGNKIFVFADLMRSEKAIFCFDTSGEFLFQVGRKGGGPQEYDLLKDVSFDPGNKLIALLTNNEKVLFFDAEGKYIRTLRYTGYYDEIEILGADTVFLARNGCYTSNTCSHISLFINGRKTREFLPSYPVLKNGSPLSYERLKKNSQGIYYLKEFCDTAIFKYVKGTFYPWLKIDFGDHSFSGRKEWNEKISEIDKKDQLTSMPVFSIKKDAWDHNLIVDFVNYFENRDLIWLRYRYQRGNHDLIYSKNNGEVINIKTYLDKNTIVYGYGPYGYVSDAMINVLDMETILDEKEESDDKIFSEYPYKGVSVDDNPVLVIYHYEN